MRLHILLAEDDQETADFVGHGLGELGHSILLAASGNDALHLATGKDLDVIILDRMLPGLDGLAVLRRLRSMAIATPVLLLTALGQIEDRVEGLEAGADDYLVKPFAFSELAARINALTRRPVLAQVATELVLGTLRIDLLRRAVKRDDRVIHLQPREFRLLEELMRHRQRVVTRTMLLERVWGFHFDPQTNIVESHISRMRAKLNEGNRPDLVETVRGVGYRMADV